MAFLRDKGKEEESDEDDDRNKIDDKKRAEILIRYIEMFKKDSVKEELTSHLFYDGYDNETY